jgi:hypothetical protein
VVPRLPDVMTESSLDGSADSAWDRWAPWLFAALTLVLGLALWEPFPPGIWHDDGVYVLLGRSLAQGDGLRYVGIPGEPLAPKFPPLYPLFLALVWTLAPRFPENAGLLGGLNLLLLSAAAGVFLAFLRRALKVPLPLAAGVTFLAWISPNLWRVTLVPLSEPLFVLTLTLALWAGTRLERGGGGGELGVFLLAGGLAFHARTLGVAVLLGGVAALALRRRLRMALLTLLGSVAVVLPWALWSRWAARSIPPSLRDILGPYGGWLFGEMFRDPVAYGAYLLENARHLLARVLALLLPGIVEPTLWMGLVLMPILVLGLWEVGRRSPVIPATLAFGLLVLLAWPFQDIRLLVPFQAVLTLGMGLGFWTLLSPALLGLRGRISVALLAGGWALLATGFSAYRLATGWPGEPYRVRSEVLMTAVQAVEENVPPGGVVGAPELWPGLQLFTGATVVPSARFHPLAGEEPAWGSPKAQFALWMETGVTHILVEHGGKVHGDALGMLEEICPPGTMEIIDRKPGHVLVALHWDDACRRKVMEGGR